MVAVSRPSARAALLEVAGEVDSLSASVLDDGVDRLLAERADTLVLDLTGVTFLASSGLAVLIRAQRGADERARTLRVVTATRAVLRVLEVTGADQLFAIHPTVADALAVSD